MSTSLNVTLGEVKNFRPDMTTFKRKKTVTPYKKFAVTVERDMCKACGYCINLCPVDVFAWTKTVNKMGWAPVEVAHENNCVGCMICFNVCPDFCIDVSPAPESQTVGHGEALG